MVDLDGPAPVLEPSSDGFVALGAGAASGSRGVQDECSVSAVRRRCRTRPACAASFSGSKSQRNRDHRAAAAASPSRSAAADLAVRPRAQRKESEQPADRWWDRKLLAVTFRGHCAQQPHPQRGLTLSPSQARLCLALTLR
jgi:hypothetical protein